MGVEIGVPLPLQLLLLVLMLVLVSVSVLPLLLNGTLLALSSSSLQSEAWLHSKSSWSGVSSSTSSTAPVSLQLRRTDALSIWALMLPALRALGATTTLVLPPDEIGEVIGEAVAEGDGFRTDG